MNQQEKIEALSSITTIEKANLTEKIKEFIEKENSNILSLGTYSFDEFSFLYKRAFSQLKAELESEDYLAIPYSKNVAFNSTTLNLKTILGQFVSYCETGINPNVLNGMASHLELLINFQQIFGFWNKSLAKVHDIDALSLKKKSEEFEKFEIQSKKLRDEVKSLKVDIEKQKKEFEQYIETRKNEISEITSKVDITRNNINTISSLLSEGQKSKGELSEIVANQKKLLDEISKELFERKKSYEKSESEVGGQITELTTAIENAKGEFDKFKEAFSFIDGKKEDIIKFTGYAADGSLGNKFYNRQTDLSNSINFWRWAVAIAIIISGVWIFLVFGYFSSTSQMEWVNLVVNVVKTSPAFFVLGFAISQYVKERNLQEEYAYRAAVAMSITAYSDMLANSDKEDNLTRQKMLLDAISRVYTIPRIHKERDGKVFSWSTKDLHESVKELTNTVKEIKDGVTK